MQLRLLAAVAVRDAQGKSPAPATSLIEAAIPVAELEQHTIYGRWFVTSPSRSQIVSGRRALDGLVRRGLLLDSRESFPMPTLSEFSVPYRGSRLFGSVTSFGVLLDIAESEVMEDWNRLRRRRPDLLLPSSPPVDWPRTRHLVQVQSWRAALAELR